MTRERAERLLSEAMYLAQFGERPPGGEDATWAKWFREVEAYLREGTPDEDESPQTVTYQEAILDGADPYEGFYE